MPPKANLRDDEVRMPAFFKAAGYRTFHVGKLDSVKLGKRGPSDFGWEEWSGGGYEHRDPMVASPAGNRRMQGWTADLWTDEALKFIRAHRDAPWFASVAYVIPHLPWVCDEKYSAPFLAQGCSTNLAACYGSIAQMDACIGRFPVLYWLHGSGGSSPGSATQVAQRYGAAMRAGKIPPMILVFPNGLPMGMYCDWKDGSVKLETMFIEELIPHIDGTFRTLAKREGRIIEGFSMGGYGAARLGFKYPRLFAAVSLLGAGPLQADFTEAPRAGPRGRDQVLGTVYGGDLAYYRAQSPWQIVEQNADKLRSGLLIRQIIGDRDETLRFNREFKQHLDALKIPHSYRQLPGIPHDPNLVLNTLGEDNWLFYRQALGADQPATAK